MAEIDFAFKTYTDEVTHQGDTVWQDSHSDAHIASTFFNTDDEYLIIATCQFGCDSGQEKADVRLVHGSTEFDGSLRRHEFAARKPGLDYGYSSYMYMTMYAPSTAEVVKIQYRRQDSDAVDARLDQVCIFVINLTEDLTENTDWWYSESTSTQDISMSYGDVVSKTFTPTNAGDHLVIFGGQNNVGSTGINYYYRLKATGTVSTSEPEYQREAEDSQEKRGFYGMRVLDFDVESQSISLQAKDDDYIHQVLFANVFILDLSAFDGHSVSTYTSAQTSLTDTFSELDSVTHNKTSGNHFVLSTPRKSYVSGTGDRRSMTIRLQDPSSDTPEGTTGSSWTNDDRDINTAEGDSNTTDTDPAHVMTVEPQTASTDYVVDVKQDLDPSGEQQWACDQYQIVAIPLELVSSSVDIDLTISAVGTVAAAGVAPPLETSVEPTVGAAGTVTAAGVAPTLEADFEAATGAVGTVAAAGVAPALETSVEPTVGDVGAVTAAGLDPAIEYDSVLSITSAGDVSIAALTPVLDAESGSELTITSAGVVSVSGLLPTMAMASAEAEIVLRLSATAEITHRPVASEQIKIRLKTSRAST